MDYWQPLGFVVPVTPPAHRIAFGQQVRALRRAHGWSSQEAFAHHLGLDRAYVSGIERGVRNPTLDVLVRISHGLGLPPADLLATLGSSCDIHVEDLQPMCRSCRLSDQGWFGRDAPPPHDSSDISHHTSTGKRP